MPEVGVGLTAVTSCGIVTVTIMSSIAFPSVVFAINSRSRCPPVLSNIMADLMNIGSRICWVASK